MALYFNVDPYYDDFDSTKNFHRILFKPGFAVQARELTQAQTILQNQVTKFADNIFKQNSPVTGGQVTTNFDCYYIKLQSTYNNVAIDVTQWEGLLIQSAEGDVIARVLQVAVPTGTGGEGDPPTLVVAYKTGTHFTDNDVIYDVNSNLAVQALANGSTGKSSVASIADGVFYIEGHFVQIQSQTVIIDKYNATPSRRIGLNITETIYDYVNDASLLDPAVGSSNYQAPGADRYVIELTLETRPIQLGDDDSFVELVRVTDGSVAKLVDGSVYNVIDDYFAKRDYETNGDYVVDDFKLTPKTNEDATKYTLSVGKGLAYVHGYRVENPTPIDLVSNRARTTATRGNGPVYIDYGSYVYVDTVRGNSQDFFDFTTAQPIDFHCVNVNSVNRSNATSYAATTVASGYIRNLVYTGASNSANANTYIYKAYVYDIQNAAPSANAITGSTNTITLPAQFSATSNAYDGVNISITRGTNAGDTRTITGYNGTSRVAYLNQNWTTTPDSSSVFVLNFDIKDTEALVSVDGSLNVLGSSSINTQGKTNGVGSGDTELKNPGSPELIFNVGNPYISTLSDTSYTTQQLWRNLSFTSAGGSVTAEVNYSNALQGIFTHFGTPSSVLSDETVLENFTVIVTDKGSNTSIKNGDIIPWVSAERTVTLDSTSAVATLAATDLLPFTAMVIAKVFVVNADNTGYVLRSKNLIEANTTAINIAGTQVNTYTFVDDDALTSKGQVYIQNGGLVSPGQKQSLYLSDVKRIVKIIDTKASGTTPTSGMLSNPTYDVTNNYTFDNGQRDGYYDHASITLKPGAPQPVGNILVLLDYYQHTGGDGYFAVTSYTSSTLAEDYRDIPSYRSNGGTVYSLRDCLDFRPARLNAQTDFTFRFSTTGTQNYGLNLPVDLTTFVGDSEYYLGRKDKLTLSKDRQFKIVEGSPSLTPLPPTEPDGSLVLANLTHAPYTGYIPTEVPAGLISDLSIEKVQHKRYTMQDISGLESRINKVEYYTSLNLLEQKAQSLQISDAYGLNRFKNGILVDDFSSYAAADTMSSDYSASINRRDRILSASHTVKNFPLKSTALVNNIGKLAANSAASLGYEIDSSGLVNYFSLPYSTSNVATQKFASRTVNVNPFSFVSRQGVVDLTPNVDNWVDTDYAPALLIVDPNLQVYSESNTITTMSVGDWKGIPGTQTNTVDVSVTRGSNWQTTTTTSKTYENQTQQNILGAYQKIDNTYSINNGYITDITVLPYIRPQQIVVRGKDMLLNTSVNNYFDDVNIDNYVRKGNIIELTGVSGTFNENDVIGYYTGGVFTPTGRVLGVYNKTSTTVRLYVAGDGKTTSYTTNGVVQNGFFNSGGTYTSSTASGSVSSTSHFGGQIANAQTATKIVLAGTASTTNGYYVGNTIYINTGTSAGQSATISTYYGANQTAILSSSITTASGDIYSMGTFKTDQTGTVYGVFSVPPNTFHTGQRVLRIDDSNGNPGAETTFARGTFYSEGLHTKAQKLDFGASPAGAKGTFVQTNYANNTLVSSSTTSITNRWDPVAQTFIFDKDNYPNGLFLSSATFFFRTKPTSDSSPINLSIVGTLNGYPNGETLDNSIVSLTPEQVNISDTPQFLDKTTATTFQFPVPIYIQPGVLYSFILKSNSKEYTVWTASSGDTAVTSSVKNQPSDPTPSIITKIGGAPYVGGLFVSQNSQTWTADQNQSLMFVIDRCVFDTTATPTLQYVVPKKLPQRTLVEQGVQYYLNANNVSGVIDSVSNTSIFVDAFNITTTDFLPTTTSINYTYNATLTGGTAAGTVNIRPGKFGTPSSDDIYLSDGKGKRVLDANSGTSFSLYAQLSTNDNAVSPIISDAGLSTYAIKWNINNCELSNNLITVTNGGTSYSTTNAVVTFSAPTGTGGTQAYGVANVVNGVIDAIYVTQPGSGYITTPTVTIGASAGAAAGATAIVSGETSKVGGNATAKYVTKKVVLDAGFDSGDLNVYLSAYRPVNTDINVYYKILNRNDTQRFDDGSWQLMTPINSSGSKYSKSRNDVIEYSFAPGTDGTDQGFVTYTSTNGQTYTSFSQFAIKIVFTSSDSTYVPFVTDLRAIALPSNVNPSF